MRNPLVLLLLPLSLLAEPGGVTFSPAAATVEAWDFVEVAAAVTGADATNPFTGASLTGTFTRTGDARGTTVEGFCDAADGSRFRIRFLPMKTGDYSYRVTYRQGDFVRHHEGSFRATDGHRRGVLGVDPAYPWHFLWRGTGEHYYFNGTTAFWLAGWRDERVIQSSIERLHRLKVNRIRVLLAGHTNTLFGEPVMQGDAWTTALRPWVATDTEDVKQPGLDFTRFHIAYWQKFERMIDWARRHDMTMSVIFDISMHKAQPAAGSEDERRYFRYAVARLAAYSNVTWDLGDDLNSYRDAAWTHKMGTYLTSIDPYGHLATSHPVGRVAQDRTSPWFGFTSIQDWSRAQHELMLDERKVQSRTGRIIPQTNEEYGYEDHYPHWAPRPPGDSAETLRRVAWDIAMAGAYGTAGESARRGTEIWPDTGGGWMNGRGDDTMVMLQGYAHIVELFTSFEYWKTEPHDELVSKGAYCLAKPGDIYAAYLPELKRVTIQLEPGTYTARWFDALSGDFVQAGVVSGGAWTSPEKPGLHDWALLLTRKR